MTPKEQTPTTRKERKQFVLPKFKTGSVDEAIEQLDLATSQFALCHDIRYATEVSIAARRYIYAVEIYSMKSHQKKIDLESTTRRFFKDIRAVSEQFERIRGNYQRRIHSDGRIKKLDTIHHLQRDYDTMGYYLTLLYDQVNRLVQLTTKTNDNKQS